MANKQTPVVFESTDLAVRDHRSPEGLGEVTRLLLTKERSTQEVVEDPEDISREILAQILSATTIEETERLEAESWRELEGVPMEIRGFAWRPSSFEEGHSVFFVVRANDLSGETPRPCILTTGSGNVMAQLVSLARLDGLVGAVREIAHDDTAAGFKVYYLRTPEGMSPTGHLDAQPAAVEPETTAA